MINENELPKNWQIKKLGDIVTKKTLKVLPADAPDAKFIGMDCIDANGLMPTFLYDFKDFKSAGNRFKSGQVLYGRMRPYLNKVYKAEFDGVCSGEFIILECLPFFTPDLLQYILHSRDFVRFVNAKTSGDRPRVSFEEISDYPIYLPPLAEQELIVAKIEELFSELDAGLESLKTAQAQLKIYRQAVLKFAFEGKLTNENVKEGELPNGWKLVMVKDVAETYGGYAFKSGEFKSDGEYQVIRMGNVRPGIIRLNESPVFLDKIQPAVLNRALLNPDDVIITQTGTRKKRDYGFTALIQATNLLLNQRLTSVRFHKSYIPKFFLYFSWTNIFKDQFFANETGNVGQGNVGMKAITETLIPFCSLEEQQHIVEEVESCLSVCDKLEETINAGMKQAEALRQSILKQAFEGKLLKENTSEKIAGVLS